LSAAEVSGQKGFDQFPGKRRPDHFAPQTKDIHVVILDALMGGENIVDEPGTHTGNFVRRDGRSHAAAAEGYSTVHLSGGDGPGEGDDEVGIVIFGVIWCAPKSTTSYPEPRSDSATCLFKAKPPWSDAIPTRIVVSP
jgi:hypothetical protein